MIDWDALADDRGNGPETPEIGEIPQSDELEKVLLGKDDSSIYAAFEDISPASPTSPKENDGGEILKKFATVDGGHSDDFRAVQNGLSASGPYRRDPRATLLAIAICERRNSSALELLEAVSFLQTMSREMQLARTMAACVDLGIRPEDAISIPAMEISEECTGCQHLTRIEYRLGRRRFFWSCKKGHQVILIGVGFEQVMISSDGCSDWEGGKC